MNGIKVISSGYYVPSKIVDNNYFASFLETNDEWITTRTGIKERRFVEDESVIDLAYKAGKDAIEKANIDINEIDLIVVASITAKHLTPSIACMVQAKLGLNDKEVMAFDINAACSGYVYALSVANGLMQTMNKKCALIIGSETLSTILDYEDRGTCILFGDGAGALVVKSGEQPLISYHNSNGNDEVLYAYSDERKMRMNGRDVFKFAVKVIPECINKVLEESNLTLDDIDYVVCHQANYRIIANVYKKLGCDPTKFYMNLDKLGNTSGASIPLALGMMDEEGLLKEGMKIICVGFGGGLTYGATLFQW